MSHASQDRDVFDDDLGRRRCVANAKSTGERCKRRPIPGGRVCKIHGGGSPQAQRTARQTLLAAVEPALAVLVDVVNGPRAEWTELADGVWKPVGHSDTDRLRAVEAILDRTGYPRRTEVSMVDGLEELEAVLDELEDEEDDDG